MKNTLVSSIVIKNEEGNVLAVRINKEQEGGVWGPPGGKIELGESAREACVREAKEELNLDVIVNDLIGIAEVDYGDGKPWVFLFYSGEIVSGTPELMESGKTMEYRYVDRSELHYAERIRWFDERID